MSENKTAMQLMVEMMDSISRNEPNTMLSRHMRKEVTTLHEVKQILMNIMPKTMETKKVINIVLLIR